jgi:hypothetical protein
MVAVTIGVWPHLGRAATAAEAGTTLD